MTRAALAAAAVSLGAACGGQVGTLEVSLVAAPGTGLIERIERVHAVLSAPHQEAEAVRGADGTLRLALEFGAADGAAVLTLEGFDAAGDRIAVARSAPLPVGAVNASVTLYAAPPLSLGEAPVALEPARSEIGAAALSFGAALIGGRGADGQPRADSVIYNVYDHELQVGVDLPAGRAAPTVVSGERSAVYVFGGRDAAGQDSAAAWSFDTSVAPAGFYAALTSDGDLARAGAAGVLVGDETVLVTGAPAVRLDGAAGRVEEWPGAPVLAEGAAARVGGESSPAILLVAGAGVGAQGAVAYDGERYRELDAPEAVQRTGHALVRLADGRGLVVGGGREPGQPDRSAVAFDPADGDGQFSVLADFLAAARSQAATAATDQVVLVAGGVDAAGIVLGDAELFDAASLEPLAVLPLRFARRGAAAVALPDGQILIAGGVDRDGAPVAALELFTPDNPPEAP